MGFWGFGVLGRWSARRAARCVPRPAASLTSMPFLFPYRCCFPMRFRCFKRAGAFLLIFETRPHMFRFPSCGTQGRKAGDWKEYIKNDGRKWYYNVETKKMQWTVPEEFVKLNEIAAAAAAKNEARGTQA